MKPRKLQSTNTNNFGDKMASTKRKINMIKLNSTVFNRSTKKLGESRSPSPSNKRKLTNSTSERLSGDSHVAENSPQINNFGSSIIAPIRCVEEPRKSPQSKC